MDIPRKLVERATGKSTRGLHNQICRLIKVYCFLRHPLALPLVGVDFGVGDIDAPDLVVKVVLLVLFFSIIREFIWTFLG